MNYNAVAMTKHVQYSIVLFVGVFSFWGAGYAQPLTFNTKKIEILIDQWNSVHNRQDVQGFETLFDDHVLFYAETMPRSKATLLKKLLFVRNPGYKQRIGDDIKYTLHRNGVVKCEFSKEQWKEGAWQPTPMYLLIGFKHQGYWIIGESDPATDKKFRFQPKIGEPLQVEIVAASNSLHHKVAPEATSMAKIQTPAEADDESGWPGAFFLFGLLAFLGTGFMIIMFRDRIPVDELRERFSLYGNTVVSAYRNRLKTFTWPADLRKTFRKPAVDESTEAWTDEPFEETAPSSDEAYHVIEHSLKQDAFKKHVLKLFNPLSFTCLEVTDEKKSDDRNVLGPYPKLDVEYRGKKGVRARMQVLCVYAEDSAAGIEVPVVSEPEPTAPQERVPSYVVLGLAGPPECPDKLYLVPVEKLNTIGSKQDLLPMRRAGMFVYDAASKRLL